MQAYSNPTRETDPYALPDIEVFELTAREVAEMDEEGTAGGWFYHYCFPGCLPDSEPVGPFASRAEALQAAQDDAA